MLASYRDQAAIEMHLVKSTSKISSDEKLRAQEDVYGIATRNPEDDVATQEVVEIKLKILEAQLQVWKRGGTAYEIAETMDPIYVKSRDFRLMFLRANRYDDSMTARNIIDFFETKMMLFGREKLAKDVTLADLDAHDKKCLQSGFIQILQSTDFAGRKVVVHIPSLRRPDFNIVNELRARYYLTMTLVESEKLQKEGIVNVHYAVGDFADKTRCEGKIETAKLKNILPVHVCAEHFCTNNVAQYEALSRDVLDLLPATYKARLKLHHGSHEECEYLLATCGVTRGSLPLSFRSNLKEPNIENHLLWYQDRQTTEAMRGKIDSLLTGIRFNIPQLAQQMPVLNAARWPPMMAAPRQDSRESSHTPSLSSIGSEPGDSGIVPGPKDVLFGTKGRSNDHQGNKHYRTLVRSHLGRYNAASLSVEKRAVSNTLVKKMRATGSRFLEYDKKAGTWSELKRSKAANKVSQCFQNYNRNSKDG